MIIRPFIKSDHITVCRWWKAHNFTALTLATLPTTGFIIDGVCAGFLYSTDSDFCLLEWVISNPEISKEERAKGLDLLIDTLLETAKEKGFRLVFSTLEHPKLIQRYEDHGFQITDKNMTNLIKVL